MTGRQGRIRKQLLGAAKKTRGYFKWKNDALDCALWITSFGRGYGPVVRQITELIKIIKICLQIYQEKRRLPGRYVHIKCA